MPVFSVKKNAFVFGLALLLGLPAQAADEEITSITVMADRTLNVPLTQLASDYSKSRHESINISYAPSFEQALAIEEGEPADLIISAYPKTLDQLSDHFVAGSIVPLVSGRLSLITSVSDATSTDITIATLRALRRQKDFLLAVAIPTASAEGYYTGQILNYLRPRLFLANNLVQLQDTADILQFLARTPAYGVVFESDVLQASNLRRIAIFPENWHQKAIFKGAVIASGRVEAAKRFLHYLQSAKAKRVFLQYSLYPEKAESSKNSPSAPRT